MNLRLLVPPASEPLALAEVKEHLRIDHGREDALIAALTISARQACEHFLNRALIAQTWRLSVDDWPHTRRAEWWDGVRDGSLDDLFGRVRRIELPKGVISVSSVATLDEEDVPTLFDAANYYVTTGRRGAITLKSGVQFPAVKRASDGIEIVFVAGFGMDWNEVPDAIRAGLKILIADLYEHRQPPPAADRAPLPPAVTRLWRPFALPAF